jgi:hypothetical protein
MDVNGHVLTILKFHPGEKVTFSAVRMTVFVVVAVVCRTVAGSDGPPHPATRKTIEICATHAPTARSFTPAERSIIRLSGLTIIPLPHECAISDLGRVPPFAGNAPPVDFCLQGELTGLRA